MPATNLEREKTSLNQPAAFAILLTVIGLVLRLVGLGARPLWFDEAISAVYARQDWSGLLALNAGDNHPPGYYALLKVWLSLFGSSEVALRLLSVLPGTAAIWLVWLVGQRFFPENCSIALTATAISALSPFQIYFSQEVRNYSFMLAAVLLAVWFWQRGLVDNHWGNWLGLGLAGTAGLLLNFTTAFYLLALGLYPFLRFKRYWQSGVILRLIGTGLATGLLSGLLLLPKLTARLDTIKGNFWIPAPDLLIVLRTFYTFIFGAIQSERFGAAFALALVIFILVSAQVGPALLKMGSVGLLTTTWLLAAPLILVVIISYLFQPLYLDKALIGCAPFYYLLIGWTVFRVRSVRRGGWILTGGPLLVALPLAVLALPALYDGTINPLYIARYNASLVNNYLSQQAQVSDRLVNATDIGWLPLNYYRKAGEVTTYPLKEYPYSNIFPALSAALATPPLSQAEVERRSGRIWAIFEVNRSEENLHNPPEFTNLAEEPAWLHSPDWQRSLLAWFETHFKRVSAHYYDRLLLVVYEMK